MENVILNLSLLLRQYEYAYYANDFSEMQYTKRAICYLLEINL